MNTQEQMRHEHGAPCWFELATTDQAGGKKFYTDLFGWTADDSPMGPGQFYTMFRKEGKDIGGGYSITEQMKGVPPHWGVHFACTSADESAKKAAELGGTVKMAPFDVMEHGRMAVVEDPTGAVFMLWEARKHSGSGAMYDLNAVTWTELATRDPQRAREFYTGLFGWKTKPHVNMDTYTEFGVSHRSIGGILQMDDKWVGMPSHWAIYFMVGDVDATAKKVKELGGKVMVPAFDVPNVGRMSLLSDPQGAAFYVVKLNPPE
jgi:predicted enzyme related to lactoylglutathione lyase